MTIEKTTKQKTCEMRAEEHRVTADLETARAEVNQYSANLRTALRFYALSGELSDLFVCQSAFEGHCRARERETRAMVEFDRYHFTVALAQVQADHAMEEK